MKKILVLLFLVILLSCNLSEEENLNLEIKNLTSYDLLVKERVNDSNGSYSVQDRVISAYGGSITITGDREDSLFIGVDEDHIVEFTYAFDYYTLLRIEKVDDETKGLKYSVTNRKDDPFNW